MANKFTSNLTQSSDGIRAKRAGFVAQDAKDVSATKLINAKKVLRDLEKEKDRLSDMNRDSELSLKVSKDDFSSDEWVDAMLAIELKIVNQKVKVKIVEDFDNEWFSEVTTSA